MSRVIGRSSRPNLSAINGATIGTTSHMSTMPVGPIRGFDRNEEVDLEAMKRHYEHSANGHHANVEELTHADDN